MPWMPCRQQAPATRRRHRQRTLAVGQQQTPASTQPHPVLRRRRSTALESSLLVQRSMRPQVKAAVGRQHRHWPSVTSQTCRIQRLTAHDMSPCTSSSRCNGIHGMTSRRITPSDSSHDSRRTQPRRIPPPPARRGHAHHRSGRQHDVEGGCAAPLQGSCWGQGHSCCGGGGAAGGGPGVPCEQREQPQGACLVVAAPGRELEEDTTTARCAQPA